MYVIELKSKKVNWGIRNTRNLFKKQIVIVFNKLDNKLICSKYIATISSHVHPEIAATVRHQLEWLVVRSHRHYALISPICDPKIR